MKEKGKDKSTGKRIKNRIEELETTQPEVAKEADVSKGALHNIKADKKKPSIRTLAKLAKVLRTSIDKLKGKK